MSSPIKLRLRFVNIEGDSVQPSIPVLGSFQRSSSGTMLLVARTRFFMLVDNACVFVEVIAEETGKRLVNNHGYGPFKFTRLVPRQIEGADHNVNL